MTAGHAVRRGDSGNLTYALFATSGSDCWVWGDDPGYYDDFGCTESR